MFDLITHPCVGGMPLLFSVLLGGGTLCCILVLPAPRVVHLMFPSGFKESKFWFMVYNLFRALDYILVIYVSNNRVFLLFNICHGWLNIFHCLPCVPIYRRCAYVISILSFIDKKILLHSKIVSCCGLFDGMNVY